MPDAPGATPETPAPAVTPDTPAPTTVVTAPSAADTPAVPAGEKPADTPAATPVVPEKYELKLPEKTLLDASVVERTVAKARELGLSNDNAQKVLETIHAEIDAREAAKVEASKPNGAEWKARVDAWKAEALADTEIGGSDEKLAASGEMGRRAVERFAGKDADVMKQFLVDTGWGSHPVFIRFLSRVGKAMAEDGMKPAGGTPPAGRLPDVEVFYGKPEAVGA